MKLLITGCNRSGTTLLGSMVNAHPDCMIYNEDYYDTFLTSYNYPVIGTKIPIPAISLRKRHGRVMVSIWNKAVWVLNKTLFFELFNLHTISMTCLKDYDKIIFIKRDFAENVNSIVRHTKKPIDFAVQNVLQSQAIEGQIRFWPNVLFVTLSELTHHPHTTIIKICGFLGINYSSAMAEGYKHTYCYSNDRIEKKK